MNRIEKIYAFPLWLRWKLYQKGILSIKELPRPVISIGGFKFGGTGKTPLTEKIVKIIRQNQLRPAILTRGYGRKTRRRIILPNNDENWRHTGDEPLVLSKRLHDVPVVIHPNRYESGMKIVHDVDVFILDDGFQRMQMKRNLDIIALAGDEFEDYIFPFGSRREGLWRLQNLHNAIFIVPQDKFQSINSKLKEFTLLTSKIIVEGVFPIHKWEQIYSIDELKDKKVFLAAGIATPERFEQSIKQVGVNVVGTQWFRDHRFYSDTQVKRVIRNAGHSNADVILVTMKDAVKLPVEICENFWVSSIELQVEPEDYLKNRILQLFG